MGALAQDALTGLGLQLRDAFTYLALVFAGAWTLVDTWQTVQDNDGRSACDPKADRLRGMCGDWAKSARQYRCCANIVSQGWLNRRSGVTYWPPMPWDDPDGELCVKGLYPEG
ncbi:MAG: hypothetical protein IT303_08490 [Dehalococcoidia bacterium]|nr:hypothetical protein [Dehalococcoidia bacterium]